MATKPDTTRHPADGLSVAQRNAVDVLAAGMGDQEVAAAVGVSRQTVNGWRNHNPAFQAALNVRRHEVWGSATDRLRALVPRALEVLEGALAVNPDPKIALEIVKLAGLADQGGHLGVVGIGPTDSAAVMEAEAQRRRLDPMAYFLSGDPMSPTERRALEADWLALGSGTE